MEVTNTKATRRALMDAMGMVRLQVELAREARDAAREAARAVPRVGGVPVPTSPEHWELLQSYSQARAAVWAQQTILRTLSRKYAEASSAATVRARVRTQRVVRRGRVLDVTVAL